MIGWLRIFRKVLSSTIWIKSKPEQKVILITLLIMANHSEAATVWKGKIYTLLPGQIITSIEIITEYAGKRITVSMVRTTLKKFEKLGFLKKQLIADSTKHGSLITINNWELYQASKLLLSDELTNSNQLVSVKFKEGWIKLHRKIIFSPIWRSTTPNQKVILIVLLLSANYLENDWSWNGILHSVKPGQFKTSLASILKKSGKDISIKNIRTALKNFELLGFLTDKQAGGGRLITIVNWASYQSEEVRSTTKPASNWQATGKQSANKRQIEGNELASIKNSKKLKNEIQEIYDYYIELNLVKHRSFTEAMETSIIKAKKKYNLSQDEMKRMLNRHDTRVKNTEDSAFEVKKRGLATFFGQKKYGCSDLICAEYMDEYYLENEDSEKIIKSITIKDSSNFI